MNTTTDLCKILAASLGLDPEIVLDHARHLHEAGMLADGGAPATVEHAVTLLIALMAAPNPEDAPDCVRLFVRLPFDRMMRCESMPDGRFESIHVPDTDPFVDDINQLGMSFGTFLVGLVTALNEAAAVNIEPGIIIVGGGLGTAIAAVDILALAEGVNVACTVQFSLAPMGGNQMPDDAPAGRLDRYMIVPGSIFAAFRKFFTNSADGPREVVMSRAEVADLLSEARS